MGCLPNTLVNGLFTIIYMLFTVICLSFSTFNWTVPWLSTFAVILLSIGAVVLYLIPIRYLVMGWGKYFNTSLVMLFYMYNILFYVLDTCS
jgi:hypothetical protein